MMFMTKVSGENNYMHICIKLMDATIHHIYEHHMITMQTTFEHHLVTRYEPGDQALSVPLPSGQHICIQPFSIHEQTDDKRPFLFQTVLKWDDVQKTDLNVWLHLYGTEADPTNIMVTNLQWGKYGDAAKVICGPS